MKFQIKEARMKAGLSQKELAKIIGVAPSTFNGYESGNHDPKSDLLIEIAKACDVTVDFLLGHNAEIAKKEAPLYSSEALKVARDYDCLDGHGKRIIRLVADEELARCEDLAASDRRPMIQAAARSGGVTEIEAITPDELADGEDIP